MRERRRWLLARVKRRVVRWLRQWIIYDDLTPDIVGRTASHHHTCVMCGNPRRYFRQRAHKEVLADRAWRDWQEGERW